MVVAALKCPFCGSEDVRSYGTSNGKKRILFYNLWPQLHITHVDGQKNLTTSLTNDTNERHERTVLRRLGFSDVFLVFVQKI
jgi:hypothetical protein